MLSSGNEREKAVRVSGIGKRLHISFQGCYLVFSVDLTHMEVFTLSVAYHKDVPQGTDFESPTGFQQAEGTVGRRDRPTTPSCADGDGGF